MTAVGNVAMIVVLTSSVVAVYVSFQKYGLILVVLNRY